MRGKEVEKRKEEVTRTYPGGTEEELWRCRSSAELQGPSHVKLERGAEEDRGSWAGSEGANERNYFSGEDKKKKHKNDNVCQKTEACPGIYHLEKSCASSG